MSKRIFAKEQMEMLLKNKNVEKCSERSILYRKDFKILAIREYLQGLPSSEIFKQAGFDIRIIGDDIPKECIRRWLRIFKAKGEAGLKTDGRGKLGGRPKGIANLPDKEKVKRLEAEVAYLKEENRFLVKLRKKSLN
jgi:transposase-like protein